MGWILEVGESTESVESHEALSASLANLRARNDWVVRLVQRAGKLAGWQSALYRLLGLSTEMDGQSVLVRAAGELAAVSLLDEDFNETLVVGPQPLQEPDGNVQFTLGKGEIETRHRADCMGTQEAISFLLRFFDQGTRPHGFRYVKLRRGGVRTADAVS